MNLMLWSQTTYERQPAAGVAYGTTAQAALFESATSNFAQESDQRDKRAQASMAASGTTPFSAAIMAPQQPQINMRQIERKDAMAAASVSPVEPAKQAAQNSQEDSLQDANKPVSE